MLIALRLKDHPRLGKLRDQPDGDALDLPPLGYRGSKIGLEGADPLTRLVALSNGLARSERAALRSERSLSVVWHSSSRSLCSRAIALASRLALYCRVADLSSAPSLSSRSFSTSAKRSRARCRASASL